MSGLFRKEAIESRQQHFLGDVFVAQPLAFSTLTLFLSIIVVVVLVYISSGTYARKETVVGFLSTDKGIVTIHAPRMGVVRDVLVSEGQSVIKDDPMMTIDGERVSGDGVAVDNEMLRALGTQIREISHRIDIQQRRSASERERLIAELSGLQAERETIVVQVQVQQDLLDNLQESFERVGQVMEKGFISKEDYQSREESMLVNRQVLASALQKQAANDARIVQVELALQRLPLEIDERRSELIAAKAELEIRRMELVDRSANSVVAPVSGTVTALRAIPGTTVDRQVPLLTILPDGGRLEAHLFVPTRAIGFVKAGQEVHLMYAAFDYRRFGVYSGSISEISLAVFAPSELRANVQLVEPSYRVTVRLQQQAVDAFGQRLPLQSGMLLRADIVLEERSLISWLFEPFTSLRGRT